MNSQIYYNWSKEKNVRAFKGSHRDLKRLQHIRNDEKA